MLRITICFFLLLNSTLALAAPEVIRDEGMADYGEVVIQKTWAFVPFAMVDGGLFYPRVEDHRGIIAEDKSEWTNVGPAFGVSVVSAEHLITLYSRLSFSEDTDVSIIGVKYIPINSKDITWEIALEKFNVDLTYEDNYGTSSIDSWRFKAGIGFENNMISGVLGAFVTYNDIDIDALDDTNYYGSTRRVVAQDSRFGGGLYVDVKHDFELSKLFRFNLGYGCEVSGTGDTESEGELGLAYFNIYARVGLQYIF